MTLSWLMSQVQSIDMQLASNRVLRSELKAIVQHKHNMCVCIHMYTYTHAHIYSTNEKNYKVV